MFGTSKFMGLRWGSGYVGVLYEKRWAAGMGKEELLAPEEYTGWIHMYRQTGKDRRGQEKDRRGAEQVPRPRNLATRESHGCRMYPHE